MGLVAEYEIRCAALPLVEVAEAVPEASIDVEIVPTRDGYPPLVCSASDVDADAIERAFASTAFVDEFASIGAAGGTHRYQVLPAVGMEERLGDHVDDVAELRSLAAGESVIDRNRVTGSGWVQTGWFADRAAFDELSDFWQRNAGFELRRLTRDGEPEPPGDGLTDCQREALRVAYERGYFEVPRRASLEDLAIELGVSASSLSERLRRAQRHLVESTVAPTWPPLPD